VVEREVRKRGREGRREGRRAYFFGLAVVGV